MKSFLRFVGVLEFILYVIGVFVLAFKVPLTGITIFYFCLYLIFGPTIAVLLFAVAQILENTEINMSKTVKLNQKIDLLVDKLVDEPTLKQESNKGNNKVIFRSPVKLTGEDKKQYKAQIQYLFNQFPFNRYANQVKDRIIDIRNEALERINASETGEDAKKVVDDFSEDLDDLQ